MDDRPIQTRPGEARRNILLFLVTRGFGAFASQMLDVAMGWHVYSTTGSALSLGFVGLAQFLPLAALLRWSGPVADRFDRRKVSAFAALGQASASLAIFVIAATDAPIWAIYPALFALGSARAFSGPANSSLLPEIVDHENFPRAVAMSTTVFQAATIAGPALGGLLFAALGVKILLLCGLIAACGVPAVLAIRRPAAAAARSGLDPAEKSALDGLRYIWSNKIVLGAISLDLFAVLFGGATALLPIYARDILLVGPLGLGVLARGAGRWRHQRQPAARHLSPAPGRGAENVPRRRGLCAGDDRLRLVDVLRPVARGHGGARGLRRREHGGAPDPGRSSPRPMKCAAGFRR